MYESTSQYPSVALPDEGRYNPEPAAGGGFATVGELLAAGSQPVEDVEVPGVGWVRVRGLTRAEALRLNGESSVAGKDQIMLTYALVNPSVSRDEAARMCRVLSAGVVERISRVALRLSGLDDGAAQEHYKSNGSGPVD